MNWFRVVKVTTAIAVSFSLTPGMAADEVASKIETIQVLGDRGVSIPSALPALKDGKIFEGKKTTVVDLSKQPNFVEPNLRQMFSKMPGLFVSDQQIPSIYNVNYRGLGNPHESEFVAFFQNDVPLAADLFGYPTMYYMPSAQRVESIEFVRGGGLLYGPQIGPAVNFVTRRAKAGEDAAFRSEHAGGSNGLYSTYNEISGSSGDFGLLASFDHRSADGPRKNEDYDVDSAYVGFAYEGLEQIRLGLDLDFYYSDSGEAGRLSSEEFAVNRGSTKTPFNRVVIDQVMATMSYEQQLNDRATLDGRVWYSGMDRLSRRSAMFTDPADEPATTAIDVQNFENIGLDLRLASAWGQGHILAAGTTAYLSDSPRTRHVSSDIQSSSQNPAELAFEQDRAITYSALFAENLFRFGDLSIVPSVRYETINYDLLDVRLNPSLSRDGIDFDRTSNETLFGLGLMYQANERIEFYFNASESYRPQRFDDLINPASELAGDNGPGVSRAMNYELGLRGQPAAGLVFDISVFSIDFKDKIEQIQRDITDVERINSGDSSHRGLEFNIEYDVLNKDSASLVLFANGSILDTEIDNSINATLVGNQTAFAPEHVVRAGFIFDSDRWNASLTATSVGQQFWQDSNRDRMTNFGVVEAKIPSYQLVDFSAEYEGSALWSLYGGVNNLLDENYYSRVRNDGIEPALERTLYLGIRFAWQ